MTLLSSLRIIPGLRVLHGEESYRVLDLLCDTEVLVISDKGQRKTFEASELLPDMEDVCDSIPDLLTIDGNQWNRALEIYKWISPLVENGKEQRIRADVAKVAKSSEVHIATVYRWLKDFESTGLISSLMRRKRNDIGKKRLCVEVEKIINETIEKFFLTEQRREPTKIAEEVRKVCKQKKLQPPDSSTVKKRILEIPEEKRVRKREGAKAADEKYSPLRGHFPGADFPLAVVQIDHTPMDVIIVDDIHRKPIGRPFLTIAIDLASKMLPGFYITLEHPSALSMGMCISRAILTKESYLTSLGIDNLEWPCWGVMRTIHTDNAMEFRGTLLGKAAKQYGIIPERRPKGKTNYGGHVERAFRTYMKEVHNELPGTTFSNVKEKMDYDSEGRAVMTLGAVEKWFTIFILGVYHQKPHKGNDGLPPIVKWDQLIHGTDKVRGSGIPMRVMDEEKLRLDFMPFFTPTVQEYGLLHKGIYYYCDELRTLIHAKDPESPKKKMKFVCRYDPRNLSRVWLYEEISKKYIEVPYRDISRPPISLWEANEARRILREESKSATNEELIFQCIDQMREIVEEESQKTKKARRQQQRMKQWKSSSAAKVKPKVNEIKEIIVKDEFEEDDFEPFEGIRES